MCFVNLSSAILQTWPNQLSLLLLNWDSIEGSLQRDRIWSFLTWLKHCLNAYQQSYTSSQMLVDDATTTTVTFTSDKTPRHTCYACKCNDFVMQPGKWDALSLWLKFTKGWRQATVNPTKSTAGLSHCCNVARKLLKGRLSHMCLGDDNTAVMTHCNNSRELYPQSGGVEIMTSVCIATNLSQCTDTSQRVDLLHQ